MRLAAKFRSRRSSSRVFHALKRATAPLSIKQARDSEVALDRSRLLVSRAASSIIITAPASTPPSASDLDWRPTLSTAEEATAAAASVLLACLLYACTAPVAVSFSYGAGMAALFASAWLIFRRFIIEHLYKEHQRPVQHCGDSDSLFPYLDNLAVHVKASVAPRAAAAFTRQSNRNSSDSNDPAYSGLLSWNSSISSDSNPGSETFQAGTEDAWPSTDTVSPMPALPDHSDQRPEEEDGAIPVLHCYHGFGANLFSYEPVMQGLAAAVGGVVSAHDCPGFGLTERPTALNKYFLEYNGKLGRLSSDFAVSQLCKGRDLTDPLQAEYSPASSNRGSLDSNVSGHSDRSTSSGSTISLSQCKQPILRVLVGHSLGGICAAMEALRVPGEVTALVLVAPAIITSSKGISSPPTQQHSSSNYANGSVGVDTGNPTSSTSSSNSSDSKATGNIETISTLYRSDAASMTIPVYVQNRRSPTSFTGQDPTSEADSAAAPAISSPVTPTPSFPATEGHSSNSPLPQPPLGNIPTPKLTPSSTSHILQRSLRLLRVCAASFAALALLLIVQLLTPFLTVLLRSVVRSKAFWIKGLSSAYQDPTRLTPTMVDHYRLPQLVRGWEQGMINFLSSRLSHLTDFQGMLKVAWDGKLTAGGMGTDAAASVIGAAANTAGKGASTGASVAAGTAAGAAAMSSSDMQLAQRIGLACASGELKVLIVHGKQDRLVPVGNTLRLAQAIPGCQVVLYDACGHTPQEEMPLEFNRDVARFVNSLKI